MKLIIRRALNSLLFSLWKPSSCEDLFERPDTCSIVNEKLLRTAKKMANFFGKTMVVIVSADKMVIVQTN